MISHNKINGGEQTFTHNVADPNIFEAKLSQQEYDSIFDNPPTFQEKKAFVEIFRRKWREDKGYCSLFEKLSQYKQAKDDNNERMRQRPRS